MPELCYCCRAPGVRTLHVPQFRLLRAYAWVEDAPMLTVTDDAHVFGWCGEPYCRDFIQRLVEADDAERRAIGHA